MKNKTISFSAYPLACLLILGTLMLPSVVWAGTISESAQAGPYSVTLKVLPAESFRGPNAEMVRDGGAKPNTLDGPKHPNHHLVAFISKDGKPVEDAKVAIGYRSNSQSVEAWSTLPVVRMHVAGKGLGTTHYGNNVRLMPGRYEARVRVDGGGAATFHFVLSR